MLNIKRAIAAFEKDPTFFLRNHPELHKRLLKIAKEKKPDGWVEGLPVWVVPKIIDKQIALAPHYLVFVSDKVNRKEWEKIVEHEKLEIELVNRGYSPEEAHKLALEKLS